MKKISSSKPRRTRSKIAESQVDESTVDTMDGSDEMDNSLESLSTSADSSRRGRGLLVAVLLLGILGFIIYRYNYVITPAVVNGKPIYVWDYLWKLHTQFGRDQLNSMVTEQVIEQAVANSSVSVPQSDIDAEIANIEKEASSSGGLNAVLEAQRLTRSEFEQRIRLQLSVKKILADKIKVSDQEIDEAYKKNKDFYKGMTEEQAKEQIKKQIEDQKFQTEASNWLSEVRKNAKVDIKFPGMDVQQQ